MAAPAARRGRPRAFDRDAALEKATRVFWRKGYEATSIADLVDAMGIGSTSLYAAFGSKDALFAEALGYYRRTYEAVAWDRFRSASTAREAVESLLADTAAALGGPVGGVPTGCMVTLSSVSGDEHPELEEMVRAARALTLERLERRLDTAVEDGEVSGTVDTRSLCRFAQAVQAGMSILARDGATRAELAGIVEVAMLGWDVRVGGGVGV